MNKIFQNLELRRRILFTLLVIAIFRFLAHIPVPGVDVEAIRSLISGNTLLGLYDVFSGGGFQNFSIVTLGLAPYINASIIIQMFTMLIPKLEELSREGESGREQINQYTKYLTIPLAFVQSFGMYFLLSTQQGVVEQLDPIGLVIFIFTLTGGTFLLTWIGDLVTEYGVGNGVSLLIFVGIISQLPVGLFGFFTNLTLDYIQIGLTLGFILLSLVVIVAVVLVNEGMVKIPLEYGRRGLKGSNVQNYLPVKINQAGVIPIIFAISVVLTPTLIAGPLVASGIAPLVQTGLFLQINFANGAPLFNLFYFLLVFGFTFLYTSIQFKPDKIADDIKRRGGFIPGIRPGSATERYLAYVSLRLTLIGAIFLGIVAILPYLLQGYLGNQSLAIGGTGLLIVVSVVLETVRQGESFLVTRSYERYLD